MDYALTMDGDDVHHVDATSAEDAMRRLLGHGPVRPLRARFLSADDAAELESTTEPRSPATWRRAGSRDSGHTRTRLSRRPPR
jgi:hypothetical protein